MANALEDAERQQALFERDVVSLAARDRANASAEQAVSRFEQADQNLRLVQESFADTDLLAPFDGIINSIEVQAFGSVSVGQPIVTLYRDDALQATILVSFEVASQLQLGQEVEVIVRVPESERLAGTITEIAQRATAVSAFPVVVTLKETRDVLRSGMAAEVAIDLPITHVEEGFALPTGVIALQADIDLGATPATAQVFTFRAEEDDLGVLELRDVTIGAVVADQVFVLDGLTTGDRVVSAGVSFVRDGMAVRLESAATSRSEP